MRKAALCLLLASALSFGQNLSFASREARKVPEWMDRLTIYEVWLNAFSQEGTIRGAIPRLPYLADLGVKVAWLGPIAKRSSAPNASPYNVADYNAVDPQYGTEQDLRDFTAAAHKLGLKVMLDIVYYHTAPDSVMRTEPDYLVKNSEGKIVRGFWPQPLPDFHNPKVRKYLIDSLVRWVRDFGADGFRCDVAAGVPADFWREAREALDRVNPDVILLSEADRHEDQLNGFDLNFNFHHYLTLRSVLRDGEPAIRLREHWEKLQRTFPRGARFLHYSDNHDWRRAVIEFSERGAWLASILNFTLDGIPLLYNGQEVADRVPTHWIAKAPIQWEEPGTAGDGKALKETLEQYRRLFKMRNTQPPLTSGQLIWINNSEPDHVLSFLRKKGEEEILVMLNLSNRKLHVTIDLPVMEYYSVENLLSEGKTWFELYSGRVSANLAGYGYVVGKKIPLAPLEPGK
jgi:cyclomaltodextrinase / maltogenic alpha-amylase / neopullulanase